MKWSILRATALVASVVPAVIAWMAAATVDPGFIVQAVAALAVFVVVAYGLLAIVERCAPSSSRSRTQWIGAGAVVYGAVAHFTVGRPPAQVLEELAPLAGMEHWVLDDGAALAFLRVEGGVVPGDSAAAAGGPDRQPIVWLHDGPGLSILPMLRDSTRRPLAAAGREGFDVVFYDQRGARFSDRLDLRRERPYTIDGHVSDLEQVRARLGAEKVILAGHRWGASLAASYLLDHPDRVERMILVSPAPLWYPAWEDFVAPAARARVSEVQASALALRQRPTLRLLIGRLMGSTSRAVAHGLVTDWEADEWWTLSVRESWRLGQPKPTCSEEASDRIPSPEGLGFFAYSYTLADALRKPDRRPELNALAVPTVILRGLCDWVASEVANEYLDLLPEARYVAVPGAGHLLWLDMVSLQDQVVADFLAGRSIPLALFHPRR